MNAERWQHIKQVLDGALAMESGEQPAYLERACLGDTELRSEVESLLLHHQNAEPGFLNGQSLTMQMPSPSASTRIGRRIGVYQLIEEIGHGGMGEVYRAARVDGQYEKQVAVKLVRGGFDTTSVLERFRHERQILASLDHPNIARLLDGGTTDEGLPYLVMELIEGTPIDQHCDEHVLSTTERLELFRPVCSAVQYAHQHLVIHRDIKPNNVLVTAEGIPKLLDFGIAKILDPSGSQETTLVHALTPEYASPEQLRGEPITTATDVYSLGVVLYQLLTGHSPYPEHRANTAELARAICELEPGRPSTVVKKWLDQITPEAVSKFREGSPVKLQKRLAGDLDNILLKALRKEPQRRYGSVEQFGEDIRRHLVGLPVTARQDGWSYRAGKFVRRHKGVVAATLIVIVTLAIGMAMTLREKRMAERRFNDVRKLANSLIFEIDDSIADLPGSTTARKLLVNRALEYLDSLSRESKGDISLQMELATAYERVGDVLGYPYAANLGDFQGALRSYKKALAIQESVAAQSPKSSKLQEDLARTYFRIANVLETQGDLTGALATLRKGLPITQAIFTASQTPEHANLLGGSYYYTAVLLEKSGELAAAFESYHQAASIRETALKLSPNNMWLRSHSAADYAGMASSVRKMGNLAQAIQMQTKAVNILTALCQEYPNSAAIHEYLGEATNRLASFQKDSGDFSRALDSYRDAHRLFQSLRTADAKNSLAKSNFAFSDNGIAETLIKLGQPVRAVSIFREAMTTFQELSPETSSNRYVRSGLADSYSGLGRAYTALATAPHLSVKHSAAKWNEARNWYEKSLTVWIDKERRGELENDERHEKQIAVENVARCDAAIHRPILNSGTNLATQASTAKTH